MPDNTIKEVEKKEVEHMSTYFWVDPSFDIIIIPPMKMTFIEDKNNLLENEEFMRSVNEDHSVNPFILEQLAKMENNTYENKSLLDDSNVDSSKINSNLISEDEHCIITRMENGQLHFYRKREGFIWELTQFTEKYFWFLPHDRPITWMHVVQPKIDAFLIKTVEIFINYGFIKGVYSNFIVMYVFCYLAVGLIVILLAAILTLNERDLIGTIQERHGPSRVGFLGLLQPIADAIKMILKEFLVPRFVKEYPFAFVAILSFLFASFFWIIAPYHGDFSISNTQYGCLFIILISLIHMYTILIAGWSSNSKYSFLGAIRTVCQLISYDIAIIFIFVLLFIQFKSFDLSIISKDQSIKGMSIKVFYFLAVHFIILFLAETSRHPFDLPEAEAESVSGYNVEYSSIKFAMFFLAEYASAIYSAVLFMICFLNPEYPDHALFLESIKFLISVFATIFARALLPRYRYDQLMRSCWKGHIPVVCFSFFLLLVLNLIF